jgi:hypothetical protein
VSAHRGPGTVQHLCIYLFYFVYSKTVPAAFPAEEEKDTGNKADLLLVTPRSVSQRFCGTFVEVE